MLFGGCDAWFPSFIVIDRDFLSEGVGWLQAQTYQVLLGGLGEVPAKQLREPWEKLGGLGIFADYLTIYPLEPSPEKRGN